LQFTVFLYGNVRFSPCTVSFWSSSVALQPRSGLGLSYGFHDSNSTMWVNCFFLQRNILCCTERTDGTPLVNLVFM
jgi:hypothetical protein